MTFRIPRCLQLSPAPDPAWSGRAPISASPNIWNIKHWTTNWLVNGIPTSYHQIITPGDSVIFSDFGSGTVLLTNNVIPASVVISNTSKIYTFSGIGNISGSTGLQKIGANTAIVNLTNNNYSGDTVISNGTLQIGSATAISPNANVTVGSGGTLQLAGFTVTAGELTGSGIVDNNSGSDLVLTIGTATGGTWNGSIQDHGAGAVAIAKNGSGTWVVGGANRFANGSGFTLQNQFNAGTTILTNGGSISSPFLPVWIGNASSASMVIAGGTLTVSNNIAVGYTNAVTGTLTVNNGTLLHGGNPANAFGIPNNLVVGAGATGVLTVNGGQILNNQALVIGQSAAGNGTLNLNGGLVQATVVESLNTPAAAVANFNGGTLQAVTNSSDFLLVPSMIMSNGLVLDDGGFTVSILSASLQSGDAFNGGLIKQGSGTVYLEANNSYTGTTLVTNGTLAGIGSIAGPAVVAPLGNIGAGDAGLLSTFTIGGDLKLQGQATMRINRDGAPTSDTIASTGNIIYGGTLVVSNLSVTTVTTSDTFQLFTAATHSGNFTSISGSPGPGLAYHFDPNTGILSVVTAPAGITGLQFTSHPIISGTTLTISGTNTGAGSMYLLTSTNIASPLNTWVPLWTNVTAGSGSFTTNIANAVNPALGRQFYILSTTHN